MNENPERLLIDTSVFIQAHRTYYAFDICPGFWNSLIWLHSKGHVISLDKVKAEIFDGKEQDLLKDWANSVNCFAVCEDPDVVFWYAKMQEWAQAQKQYLAAAKKEFAEDPDAWILAYAKAKNFTLVTQEDYRPNAKARILQPNVCNAPEFKIENTNIFKMLAKYGVKFHFKE
jgi:hypothetical protein